MSWWGNAQRAQDAHPLGDVRDDLKTPACEICRERFGYRIGIPFEEQKLCRDCCRLEYIMDRLMEALR